MTQQPRISPNLRTGVNEHLVAFPTRRTDHVPTKLHPHSTVRPSAEKRAQFRTRTTRQVLVAEVAGLLRDIVLDLDYTIQMALAEKFRGVICDLSGVVADDDPVALEVLATAGRHVRDWPGIPVAVACPDPRVREALRAHLLGCHLIVTESLPEAINAVLATPALNAKRLRLAPAQTAPKAAREFVTRTLRNHWRLGSVIPFADLVVSELVADSMMDTDTGIEVSIVWDRGALRLTVRSDGPALPGPGPSNLEMHQQRLSVVALLSRTFGVLPTADGGSLMWAVLEAPRALRANQEQEARVHALAAANPSAGRFS